MRHIIAHIVLVGVCGSLYLYVVFSEAYASETCYSSSALLAFGRPSMAISHVCVVFFRRTTVVEEGLSSLSHSDLALAPFWCSLSVPFLWLHASQGLVKAHPALPSPCLATTSCSTPRWGSCCFSNKSKTGFVSVQVVCGGLRY